MTVWVVRVAHELSDDDWLFPVRDIHPVETLGHRSVKRRRASMVEAVKGVNHHKTLRIRLNAEVTTCLRSIAISVVTRTNAVTVPKRSRNRPSLSWRWLTAFWSLFSPTFLTYDFVDNSHNVFVVEEYPSEAVA